MLLVVYPSCGTFRVMDPAIGLVLLVKGNLFDGEIPEFLINLQNLVSLNLANNDFSGSISPNFNKLTRLSTLYLEGNKLNGSIPDLYLGSLSQFNVSFNKLTGSIPERLSTMPASSFEGNSLCGKPLLLCNGVSNGNDNKLSVAAAWIVMGCFAGCFSRRKRREVEIPGKKAVVDSFDVPTATGYRRAAALARRRGGTKSSEATVLGFDLEDLLKASAEVLGKGTFGTSYTATLDTGTAMVVKRLKDFNASEKEFQEMIETIEKTNHENLFPLTAYYYSIEEKLLVYDYMPMGSLYSLLHGNRSGGRSPLNWDTRIGIALGTAKAIAHLHSEGPTMAHGNIKSSNILLTKTLEARLSDYGLPHFAGPSPAAYRVHGYHAPEVSQAAHTYKVTQKADVYSFGVLFLELLTGKDPNESYLRDEGLDLPRWMLSAVKDEWTTEVFDVELLRYEDIEVLLQYLELAFSWTAMYPYIRPSMAQVISQIGNLQRSSKPVQEKCVDTESSLSRDMYLLHYLP